MAEIWNWLLTKALVIGGVAAGVFLLLAVLLRVNFDVERAHYANETELSGSDPLIVALHPTNLSYLAANERGYPISIWISATATTSVSTIYTVTIIDEGHLLFEDESGKIASAPFVITVPVATTGRITVYVRPKPLQRRDAVSTRLHFDVATGGIRIKDVSFGMRIDSERDTWGRALAQQFSEGLALPLALASGFLGYLIDNRRRHVQSVSQSRQATITAAKELMQSDPIRAGERLLAIENQVAAEGWPEDLRTEVGATTDQFKATCRQKESMFLEEIGKALDKGLNVQAARLFAVMEDYMTQETANYCRTIHSVLLSQKSPTTDDRMSFINLIKQAAVATTTLWQSYPHQATRFATQVLLRLVTMPVPDPDGLKDLLSDVLDVPKCAPLWHLPELQRFFPRLAMQPYVQPSLARNRVIVDDPPVESWLENLGISNPNPFRYTTAADDPYLQRYWEDPERWGFVRNEMPLVVRAACDADCDMAAHMLRAGLRGQYQSAKGSPTNVTMFDVSLSLPLETSDGSLTDIVRAISSAYAEVWLSLLENNQWIIMSMPDSERRVLLQMLSWYAGSLDAVRLRLRLLDKEVEQPVDAFEDVPEVAQLHLGQLFTWLRVRPPRFEKTCLVVTCRVGNAISACVEEIKMLAELDTQSAEAGVILKVFLPEAVAFDNPFFNSVNLRWSDDALRHMLDARIQHASRNKLGGLTDLFDVSMIAPSLALPDGPNDPVNDLQDKIDCFVRESKGSLGYLLERCDALIRSHVQSGVDPEAKLAPSELDRFIG
ncbi:MAG: hypothetical protein M1546_02265 [Chloroflexi bacterium]|nr:hypothetical protein [Chloroflexota bacterium]